jgi:Ni/Co efflux regulator RcnB
MMEAPMNTARRFLFVVIATVSFLPVIAHAKNDHGNGNGNSHGKGGYEDSSHHDGDTVTIRIGDWDRNEIHDFIADDYRRNCPPGLAKKHNGCMPPGQAKKWRVGYPLPDDVVFIPINDDLLGRLSPLPRGYRYVQVDKDILLIGEATKKVIDAVTLLSAVGN